MSDADRVKWDARHRERGSPGEPSPWVRSLTERLPRTGRALDVAGGTGRHALVLARHGLEVTLTDVSPEGLAIAAEAARAEGLALTTAIRDLEDTPLPAGPWDVILCFHFLDRALYRTFPAALAPGGTLAIVHPTKRNLERHAHPGAAYLLEPGELPTLVAGVRVDHYEEAWLDEGWHEARLIGSCQPATGALHLPGD